MRIIRKASEYFLYILLFYAYIFIFIKLFDIKFLTNVASNQKKNHNKRYFINLVKFIIHFYTTTYAAATFSFFVSSSSLKSNIIIGQHIRQ